MGFGLTWIVTFTSRHVDGRFGGFVAALRRPSVPVHGITEGRSWKRPALGARSGERGDYAYGVNFQSRL